MSFWHHGQLDFCDLDVGDVIILLTAERKLVLAELSPEWHLGTVVNPVTGEEYSDEVCEYRLTEYGGYDWIDTKDILCWAYMDDLYKFLPAEFALKGAPDLGTVVTYERNGNLERRLFYDEDKKDVLQFLASCRECPEIALNDQPIETFYLDKCEE